MKNMNKKKKTKLIWKKLYNTLRNRIFWRQAVLTDECHVRYAPTHTHTTLSDFDIDNNYAVRLLEFYLNNQNKIIKQRIHNINRYSLR